MSAERHLRLVDALDADHEPSDVDDGAARPARAAGSFRHLPPDVADAWRVLRGDRAEGRP